MSLGGFQVHPVGSTTSPGLHNASRRRAAGAIERPHRTRREPLPRSRHRSRHRVRSGRGATLPDRLPVPRPVTTDVPREWARIMVEVAWR